MAPDLPAAVAFMASHGRTLDRRRLQLFLARGDAGPVLGALDGYRNPDGGYGWGLEPDLRSAESQPAAALHAMEVFADIAPATTPRALELCDWLASVSLADGGLPFALPVTGDTGVAPFWARADPTVSSLQITGFVAATAQRVAAYDPAVAGHQWLASATRYCLDAIRKLDATPHALVLLAALWVVDVVHDKDPEAAALLDRLGAFIPAGGHLHVAGGTEEEAMHPLDFAPAANRPVRELFAPQAIAADLERLVSWQQDDGGWRVDFTSYSPAAALEWRGYMTVRAVSILRDNGLL